METLTENQSVDFAPIFKQEETWYQMLKNSEKHIENLQQQLDLFSSTQKPTKDENKQIDHFQNLFHYYRTDVIRNLKHTIRLDEQYLNELVKKHPGEYYDRFQNDFGRRKEEMTSFFDRFVSICDEFNGHNFHRKVFNLS